MCGIAGIVRTDSRAPVSQADIEKMCSEIVYRGPDDQGISVHAGVGLGMRRLSIIDIAGGKQPIHNEDGTVEVVFNGEIYNFLELRQELEQRGHFFYTHSDTEVIVHLYEEHGADFVKWLRGMFAIALYDFRRRKLILGRDRLGKKPLYYAFDRGSLYFASEIKSILAVAPWLAEVDNEGIAQYFYYGYIPDPVTVFSRIKKVPPGHYLELGNGTERLARYWDVPRFCSIDMPESECLKRLEESLEDSVRRRLISEVPLGALLSGGVDSSVVVAMMARTSRSPVKTFSIGFAHSDFDEAVYARSVATRFGTDHHELTVDANLWDTLQSLSEIIDEPLGDSSIIPTYHVARIARKHVTVALSGDGGDELFAGYDGYSVHHQRRHLDLIPAWVAPAYHKFIYPFVPKAFRKRKLAYNFVLNSRERFISGRESLLTYDPDLTILSADFLTSNSDKEPPGAIMRRYFDSAPATDFVSRMQYTDIKTYLTADVLTKVDRMSMACSLEIRSPLLDHTFVELAVQLPLSMKLNQGTRKYLLRRLAEKLGVPRETLYRAKQGFSLPLKHWMRAELKEEVTTLLLEPRTLQRGYFQKSGVEELLREHHKGTRDHSNAIWQLLAFELWHRNYFERRRTQSLSEVEA